MRTMQRREMELERELGSSTQRHDALRIELEALRKICLENDERVKYYQARENELQLCLDKAITQVCL